MLSKNENIIFYWFIVSIYMRWKLIKTREILKMTQKIIKKNVYTEIILRKNWYIYIYIYNKFIILDNNISN